MCIARHNIAQIGDPLYAVIVRDKQLLENVDSCLAACFDDVI